MKTTNEERQTGSQQEQTERSVWAPTCCKRGREEIREPLGLRQHWDGGRTGGGTETTRGPEDGVQTAAAASEEKGEARKEHKGNLDALQMAETRVSHPVEFHSNGPPDVPPTMHTAPKALKAEFLTSPKNIYVDRFGNDMFCYADVTLERLLVEKVLVFLLKQK